MPIRRRSPEPVNPTGYPLPLFTKFAFRFGQVVACFLNCEMQVYTGMAERTIKYRPGWKPSPAIEFLSLKAVTEDRDSAVERGLDDLASMYDQIIKRWPHNGGQELGSASFHYDRGAQLSRVD